MNKILGNNRGFTMMELVMVIVILGVLGSFGASFIAEAFLGFSQTNSRLELYEEGKSALARMERELHGMVPNAICVSNGGACLSDGSPGHEIRFGMIAENTMQQNTLVGKYQEGPAQLVSVPNVLTDMNGPAAPPAGSILSVYNTNWVNFSGGSRLFQVSSSDAGTGAMTLSQNIATPSPYQRYYVVDRAVKYRWDSTSKVLSRSIETVGSNGVSSFSATEYPLALDVVDFNFYYAAPSLARNGIISMVFTLAKNGEQINMHKEIHVKNVP